MSDYRCASSVLTCCHIYSGPEHTEASLIMFFKLVIQGIAIIYLHPTLIKAFKGKSFEIHTASSQCRFLQIQLLPCFN